VFISYLTFENSVLAFTLQPNGQITAHNLGEIPSLEKDLETYRRQIARGRGRVLYVKKNDTQKLSRKLGKRLLEPLKDIIKDKQQWIISPSGALAFIPFETLRFRYAARARQSLQKPQKTRQLICDGCADLSKR